MSNKQFFILRQNIWILRLVSLLSGPNSTQNLRKTRRDNEKRAQLSRTIGFKLPYKPGVFWYPELLTFDTSNHKTQERSELTKVTSRIQFIGGDLKFVVLVSVPF